VKELDNRDLCNIITCTILNTVRLTQFKHNQQESDLKIIAAMYEEAEALTGEYRGSMESSGAIGGDADAGVRPPKHILRRRTLPLSPPRATRKRLGGEPSGQSPTCNGGADLLGGDGRASASHSANHGIEPHTAEFLSFQAQSLTTAATQSPAWPPPAPRRRSMEPLCRKRHSCARHCRRQAAGGRLPAHLWG
jgi:hypothetical protein